jgi:hypothetical protein
MEQIRQTVVAAASVETGKWGVFWWKGDPKER